MSKSGSARPAELVSPGRWAIYERMGAGPVTRVLPHAPDPGDRVSIRRTDWDGSGTLTVLCAGDDQIDGGVRGLVLLLPQAHHMLEYRDGGWHSLIVPLASIYPPS